MTHSMRESISRSGEDQVLQRAPATEWAPLGSVVKPSKKNFFLLGNSLLGNRFFY